MPDRSPSTPAAYKRGVFALRPRLLDLFCGAGGASMGYHNAGWDVVGVDLRPQPSYPFQFVQDDVLHVFENWASFENCFGPFDAVHASCPCQRWSMNTPVSGDPMSHPDLITPTREFFLKLGLPYVIENVVRAPLRKPVLMCGAERGLRLGKYVLRRHRIFEANWSLWSRGCGCYRGDGITLGVYGGGTSDKARNPNTKGGRPYKGRGDERKMIMGMPWCRTIAEVNEAIPPAYTEWIGAQLLASIEDQFPKRRAAAPLSGKTPRAPKPSAAAVYPGLAPEEPLHNEETRASHVLGTSAPLTNRTVSQ
jgi:DNA (cytosine-5)-methyltransferase 1